MPERGPVQFLLRFFRSLGRGEWLALALIAGLAGYGLMQLGEGVLIKAKSMLAQYLLEEAWEQALAGKTQPKPWPWADTWPVAKLSVPRLGQSAVVLEGVSGEAMAFGPGHMAATPRPGRTGTSVIAAHRDTHFAFLRDVNVGDKVTVTTSDGKNHRFVVTRRRVVEWSHSGIDPFAAGSNLALVTCWPLDATQSGPLRLVIEARGDEIPAPSKIDHLKPKDL